MIYFIFKKEKLVKSSILENVTCENCHTKGKITLDIYKTNYALFGVNTFPFLKQAYSHCENCGDKRSSPILPKAIREEFKVQRKGVGGVSFSDFNLFYAFIAFVIIGRLWTNRHGEYSGYHHDNIRAAEAGDRIWLNPDENGFDGWQIYKVQNDSFYVHPLIHKAATNQEFDKLDESNSYDKSKSQAIAIEDVHKMQNANEIRHIKMNDAPN